MNDQNALALTSKVTVVLTNSNIACLDQTAILMRRHTGKAVDRSAIVRGILSALIPYYGQLYSCGSEQQVASKVAALLAGGRK